MGLVNWENCCCVLREFSSEKVAGRDKKTNFTQFFFKEYNLLVVSV